VERIDRSILFIRGQKVLLDATLSDLYGVPTKVLNQAVSRNWARFPADFMFQLTAVEFDDLRHARTARNLSFQSGISSWGGRRTRPYVFTEQGAAMLSSVLRSERAVAINIEIMRAFVRLRQIIATHADLAHKIEELDRKFSTRTKEHAEHIRRIYDILEALMEPPPAPPKQRIGFRASPE